MAHFYCLDCAALTPDDYKAEVPVERWLSLCKTAGASGFGKGELTSISSPPAHVLIERFFGFPFYMLLNVLPFLLPLAWVCGVLKPILLFYVGPLFVGFVACSLFLPRAKLGKTMKELQYAYTERNTQLYLSLKMLWPASLHFPKLAEQPLLFAVIPHGFAPLGITAYPLWSKLFSRRLTRWTTAPVVLKIPIVGAGLRAIGYLPAKAHAIEETLTTKDQSVGVVLDGIAGMFQNGPVEKAWVQTRKGIVKIALRTGAPLVPVYAFGHTRLWTVVADPFGLLSASRLPLTWRLCSASACGAGRLDLRSVCRCSLRAASRSSARRRSSPLRSSSTSTMRSSSQATNRSLSSTSMHTVGGTRSSKLSERRAAGCGRGYLVCSNTLNFQLVFSLHVRGPGSASILMVGFHSYDRYSELRMSARGVLREMPKIPMPAPPRAAWTAPARGGMELVWNSVWNQHCSCLSHAPKPQNGHPPFFLFAAFAAISCLRRSSRLAVVIFGAGSSSSSSTRVGVTTPENRPLGAAGFVGVTTPDVLRFTRGGSKSMTQSRFGMQAVHAVTRSPSTRTSQILHVPSMHE